MHSYRRIEAKMLTFPAIRLASPRNEKRTVMHRRRRNSDLRTREYLTEAEVERLIEAARGNRWGHRDSTMLLIAFRHGLRASELVRPALGADRSGKRNPARP